MDDILYLVVRTFKFVYDADDRPDARRFTIGCFLVVLVVAFAILLYAMLS